MKGLEKVLFEGKLVALIYRKNIAVDGVKFLTEESNSFQIGLHNQQKGIKLSPHMHKISEPIIVKEIQELLFVLSGKIRVTLYNSKGGGIAKKTLTDGDSILLLSQGHGVDFLKTSKIFEVKQGPYPGTANAKLYFKH